MGASSFETYSDGRDVRAAFNQAVNTAVHEYGHSHYTGTIAEKDTFVVITQLVMDYDDACAMAAHLTHIDDPRVTDKWGPAGAIPVKQPTRTVLLDNLTLPADPASGDAMAALTLLARERQLISDTETVVGGTPTSRTSYFATLAKDPAALAAQREPDGWLFFGCANS